MQRLGTHKKLSSRLHVFHMPTGGLGKMKTGFLREEQIVGEVGGWCRLTKN